MPGNFLSARLSWLWHATGLPSPTTIVRINHDIFHQGLTEAGLVIKYPTAKDVLPFFIFLGGREISLRLFCRS